MLVSLPQVLGLFGGFLEVSLASAMRLEGELQEELLLRSGSRCTRFQTMVSVPSTPQPALAMPIAGPASAGWEIGESIVRLLRLPVKDSGWEISPSGSHTQQSQHPWGGTAAASGLSSKRNALRMAEPGGRMRPKVRQSRACAVFEKHFPQAPRPRGDGDTERGLCFQLNLVALWMKGTFSKFVKWGEPSALT